jgi:hypothetical protein
MGFNKKLYTCSLAAILLGGAPLACVAEAQIVSRSGDVVVVPASSLPDVARQGGVALQLYGGSGDGSSLLYVEQSQGANLLVLDVTDPAHVKTAGTVPLAGSGAFDFERKLGTSAFLVRFRNNAGWGVLDVRRPKAPALKVLSGLKDLGSTESLGDSAFLVVDGHSLDGAGVQQDYQVIDSSNPEDPAVLATVKQVSGEAVLAETGTTFLLGSEGLTIIRHPEMEAKYKLAESYSN